jgi:uncharacterized protein YbjT (DUF2867 family)
VAGGARLRQGPVGALREDAAGVMTMQGRTAALAACGDLGCRLAALLEPGHWRLAGLRRNPGSLPEVMAHHAVDVTRPGTLAVLAELAPELLLFTPTPLDRSAAGYRAGFAAAAGNIVAALGGHQPRLAIMVSSTRVYAERGGGWVDENGLLARDDPHAAAIIEAEEAFLEGLQGAVVLRCAGLYGGEGPGFLLRRVAAGQLTPRQPERFGNRIHRDDVAGFMAWLLDCAPAERVYNLVDDAPVPLQEVERWLCEQLGRPWDPEDGSVEAVANKRISNRRLRDSGYALRYPDYRAGYGEVLRRWLAHSEREDSLDFH